MALLPHLQEPLFPIDDAPQAPPPPPLPPAAAEQPAAPAAAPAPRKARPTISEAPTRVLRLANMATREDLVDKDTYTDILEDVAGVIAIRGALWHALQEHMQLFGSWRCCHG